jgi:hypothetical protein
VRRLGDEHTALGKEGRHGGDDPDRVGTVRGQDVVRWLHVRAFKSSIASLSQSLKFSTSRMRAKQTFERDGWLDTTFAAYPASGF